ncbi:hypothetical protein ACR2XU_28175, partial [Klebsiella pneumoniae]
VVFQSYNIADTLEYAYTQVKTNRISQ